MQPVVFAALRDVEDIFCYVLADDVPRLAIRAAPPADAQAAALTERVVHHAVVLAEQLARGCAQLTALRRNVLAEKLAEIALADKADAGRILLVVRRQRSLARKCTYLGLGQIANREQRGGELLLPEGIEKVALILVRITPAQQAMATVNVVDARVVAGCDFVGAECASVFEKGLEFDLAVAQYVGIRRAPGAIFAQEILEDLIPVLGGEVAHMERNVQFGADAQRIGAVAIGLAFAEALVLLPVLHEQTAHTHAGAREQQRGDRGIDTAGDAEHDVFAHARASSRGSSDTSASSG